MAMLFYSPDMCVCVCVLQCLLDCVYPYGSVATHRIILALCQMYVTGIDLCLDDGPFPTICVLFIGELISKEAYLGSCDFIYGHTCGQRLCQAARIGGRESLVNP